MKVEVCVGARCTMLGADIIMDRIAELKEDIEKYKSKDSDVLIDDIEIVPVNCFKYCKKDRKLSPAVKIDGEVFTDAKSEVLMEYITDKAFEKNFNK